MRTLDGRARQTVKKREPGAARGGRADRARPHRSAVRLRGPTGCSSRRARGRSRATHGAEAHSHDPSPRGEVLDEGRAGERPGEPPARVLLAHDGVVEDPLDAVRRPHGPRRRTRPPECRPRRARGSDGRGLRRRWPRVPRCRTEGEPCVGDHEVDLPGPHRAVDPCRVQVFDVAPEQQVTVAKVVRGWRGTAMPPVAETPPGPTWSTSHQGPIGERRRWGGVRRRRRSRQGPVGIGGFQRARSAQASRGAGPGNRPSHSAGSRWAGLAAWRRRAAALSQVNS